MPRLYGENFTKDELMKRIGDISQVGGVKLAEFADGNERGVRALLFRTGTGFSFTVLPDRGMDISAADYRGRSLCWRSSTGDVAPSFYEEPGIGWLRSFYGGLLATCGLTYVGAPSVDEGESLGVHGRASNIPARNVYVDGAWEGDDYVMWAQGKVRETRVFGEDVLLTRKVWSRIGESRLYIEDAVENLGHREVPHMILYHINGGYPAVDEGSSLVSPTIKAIPRDEAAKVKAEEYHLFEKPTPGFKERVYYHQMKEDAEGYVHAALINKKFNSGEGFGFYVKYRKRELSNFVEWKMNGEGTYVVGMEPSNCGVEGRAVDRARGTLQFLKPGEVRKYGLEIGVLSSMAEIEELEGRVRRVLK